MIANKNYFTENLVKDTNIVVFAFMGDSVYTTFIRSKIVPLGYKTGKLNYLCNKYVCATGQAVALDYIKESLTEEEDRICNTARNYHTKNIAKHATIETYKKATSFESVIGYLYLTGQNERLDEILNKVYLKVSEYYDNRG